MGCPDVAQVQCIVRPSSLLKRRFVLSWQVLLLLLCVPPLFSGCGALTTHTPKNNVVTTIVTEAVPDTADARSADFRLSGRVSVKGGKESFSGGVQWHHTGRGDEILLLSPLGQTLAQIHRTSEGVYLTTSKQESYYAADVESLTEQVLGWRLPLAGLQYWVQSMSSPATASAIDLDMYGRVLAIRQDGWEIDYSGRSPVLRAETGQDVAAHPKLITLRRNDLQIKLLIDNWNPSG